MMNIQSVGSKENLGLKFKNDICSGLSNSTDPRGF